MMLILAHPILRLCRIGPFAAPQRLSLRRELIFVGVLCSTLLAQLAFGAMLVVALVYRGSLITRPLRSRVAVFIADLSFCIYLVHLALIDLYVTVLHRFGVSDLRLLGSSGTVAVRTCVVGVAAVIVAMLSRKYLERPLLRLKVRFPYAGALSAPARAQAPRAN